METRTDDEPRIAKNANRGVRRLPPRLGRPNPYGVQWPERVFDPATGTTVRKIKTEFFPKEDLRDKRFDELCKQKREGFLATLSREEVAEFIAFKAAIGDTPWQEVVAGWHCHQQATGAVVCTITVAELAKEHLLRFERLKDRKQRADTTYKKVKKHCEMFAAAFGHMRADKVTGDKIEEWIDGLEGVESEATFNTYRRDLHALFEPLVADQRLRLNPLDKVTLRDELTESVPLTVDHTARLLHTALTYRDGRGAAIFHRILPRLVSEVFAGLRTSSAARLVKEDVNFEDRGITLPARKLKTKRRHYVSGFPEVLWAWFKLATDEGWAPITERQYRELKSVLFSVAQVPHPRNCLRHGFASYLLAVTKDAGLVAYLLCHVNQEQLYNHYNGRVTEKEGKRWITLLPEKAAEIAGGSDRGGAPRPAPG